MVRTSLHEVLLDLAFGRGGACEARARDVLPELADADWSALASCAQQHRLEPILHHRLAGEDAVPEELRRSWRDSYRVWAMKAAAAHVDLRETFGLLQQEGFAPLALKGAFLAWHAYPAPALRPLRDIDLLVPADRVTDAFALLCERGWVSTVSGPLPPLAGKHLPPLTARCGTSIELHHRMWEREGELDHASPIVDHDAVRARAVTIDGIAYPCPEDMLAHLIVHAVYSHRLDCGPLLLSDVRWLAEAWPIDWNRLRARAVVERWEPGLDLIVALLRRFSPGEKIAADLGEAEVPATLVDAAADLLLQDLDTRRSAGLAATALVRGVGAAAARVRRGASARLDRGQPHAAGPEGLGAWTGTRLRRTVGELIDPTVRNQARDLSRLSKWLGA